MKHFTRFRAYQLGEEGSSFSLVVDNHFTLIEAKITDTNKANILKELELFEKSKIDVLHITSWDTDHCDKNSLEFILENLQPSVIEYPSYTPDSETGRECLKLIKNYDKGSKIQITISRVQESEGNAIKLIGRDIFLNPQNISTNHNDNSIVKFFRIGSYQILSLGDCESSDISERLQDNEILKNEVDVLILAHHGSNNSICTKEFLKNILPKVAICTSNYDNRYEHPHKVIRNRLYELQIPYFTTKTGDIIIQSVDKYSFNVYNLCNNNKDCNDPETFKNKTWYIND